MKLLLTEQGFHDFSTLIDELYNDEIRNSFAHSDYNFCDEGMVINCNRNLNQKTIRFDELSYQLNLMFNFFQVFLDIWVSARKSYPNNYKFKQGVLTVTLTTDERTNILNGFTMGLE